MSKHLDPRPELPIDPDSPGQPQALHVRADALLLVAVGGVIGTLARYGLSRMEPGATEGWPWGTFTANIAGAFVLGALLDWLGRTGPDRGWRQRVRLLTGTGFCGGFTTYSSLAVEGGLLVRAHHAGLAVAYLAVTVTVGLLATIGGVAATRHHRGTLRETTA